MLDAVGRGEGGGEGAEAMTALLHALHGSKAFLDAIQATMTQ